MKSASESLELRRGDLVWVNCERSVGAEPKRVRTCVVVSNDIANRFGQVITAVPTQRFTAERNGRAYMVDLRSPRSNLKHGEHHHESCAIGPSSHRQRFEGDDVGSGEGPEARRAGDARNARADRLGAPAAPRPRRRPH